LNNGLIGSKKYLQDVRGSVGMAPTRESKLGICSAPPLSFRKRYKIEEKK
jgi:hypothetical protein